MRAPNPPKTTSTAHFKRHARLVASSCAGKKNGNEDGVDCGGTSCAACPSCDDSVRNGDEVKRDCGGSCSPCPTCADGLKNSDEEKVDCGGTYCKACPRCDDRTKNGDETKVTRLCFGGCVSRMLC